MRANRGMILAVGDPEGECGAKTQAQRKPYRTASEELGQAIARPVDNWRRVGSKPKLPISRHSPEWTGTLRGPEYITDYGSRACDKLFDEPFLLRRAQSLRFDVGDSDGLRPSLHDSYTRPI